ncbi:MULTISPECIES: hypothetical protein [Streptacidiphilus]|uniref:DUF2470 domain-containing protein n=1 Tax=Streptacidiphilus cavernicola TaxID=3342716 RepID=A0ABV6UEM2_9ACTN
MTTVTAIRFADPREAPALGAFLSRLLRYDKAAVVRLQTANGALAVFGRLPLGENGPLVVRTAPLATQSQLQTQSQPQPQPQSLDATVSAGQLLDGIAEHAEGGENAADLVLPPPVTGPSWAGLLPPRTSWEHVADLDTALLDAAVQAAITEFRQEGADPDALAESIWSRQVHPSGLTMRAVHAAHLVGLLRQSRTVALHRHPAWLRITAPRGAVIIRRAPAPGAGLGLSPTR